MLDHNEKDIFQNSSLINDTDESVNVSVLEKEGEEELFDELEKGNQLADAIPKSSRILLLISASLCNLCFFTHGTNINTLQAQIIRHLDITETEYGLITTFMAAPSVIVPIFLGAFIDKIGARKSLYAGAVILVLGDLIMLLGVNGGSLFLSLVGSFIFGFGTDSIVISKAKILQKWFKGKDFALATGAGVYLIAIFNIALSSLSPVLYKLNDSLFLPFFVQVLLALFSLAMTAVATYFDKKYEHVFEEAGLKETIEKFSFAPIKQLSKLYWYICLSGVFSYGTYSLLNLISSNFCQKRFGFPESQSGFLRSIPQFGIILGIPLVVGRFMDRSGKRIHFFILGVVFLMMAFVMNASLPNCDQCFSVVAPFIMEGVFIGTFGVVFYTLIGMVVKTENVGVAMGVFTWLFGLFCGILSPVDGKLIDLTKNDEKHGYFTVFWFLFSFQIVCLALLFLALRKDLKLGGLLSGKPKSS